MVLEERSASEVGISTKKKYIQNQKNVQKITLIQLMVAISSKKAVVILGKPSREVASMIEVREVIRSYSDVGGIDGGAAEVDRCCF